MYYWDKTFPGLELEPDLKLINGTASLKEKLVGQRKIG